MVRREHGSWVFPDGRSALILVAARLRHCLHKVTKWDTKRYFQMNRSTELVAIA